jgi:hypothetical protein
VGKMRQALETRNPACRKSVNVKHTNLDRFSVGFLAINAQCSPLLPNSRSMAFFGSGATGQIGGAGAEQRQKEWVNHGLSARNKACVHLHFITRAKSRNSSSVACEFAGVCPNHQCFHIGGNGEGN